MFFIDTRAMYESIFDECQAHNYKEKLQWPKCKGLSSRGGQLKQVSYRKEGSIMAFIGITVPLNISAIKW